MATQEFVALINQGKGVFPWVSVPLRRSTITSSITRVPENGPVCKAVHLQHVPHTQDVVSGVFSRSIAVCSG